MAAGGRRVHAQQRHLHFVADCRRTGWERFTLLGHSLGGGVASLLAAAAPERVEALIAIEALGALAEPVQSTATRLRDAVASARTLAERSLRLFPSMEMPVRARMMANQLTDRLHGCWSNAACAWWTAATAGAAIRA